MYVEHMPGPQVACSSSATRGCRSIKYSLLPIPYVYYFRAYQRQWNRRQIIRWKVRKLDDSGRKRHWLSCVSKEVSARVHEYVGLIEIMPPPTVHGIGVITKLMYLLFLRHFRNQ